MSYRIVQTTATGEFQVTELPDQIELLAWCAANDVQTDGVNRNTRQRAELQGQPKLTGFCGPMWDGNGVIRYECTEAYRQLSA